MKMDAIYSHLWSTYENQTSFRPPRDFAYLYEIAALTPLAREAQLLDAGCGRGDHAFELATRLACHVTGVDPVAERVHAAATRDTRPPNTRFIQGSLEQLPFADASFDFVWCADVLVHVEDLHTACAECHRVLRPAGTMLTLVSCETAAMLPADTDYYPHLGVAPASLRRDHLERAFRAAGFTSVREEELHAELLESADNAHAMLYLARLNRHRKELLAQWGQERYNTIRAFHLWTVHHLLGKLTAVAYLLRRP
jgi:SAM-dependent methyltransferase